MKLTIAFLNAPEAPLDTSCATQVVPPSFDRPADEIAFFLGSSSLWSGVAVKPPTAIPKAFLDLARLPRPYERGVGLIPF